MTVSGPTRFNSTLSIAVVILSSSCLRWPFRRKPLDAWSSGYTGLGGAWRWTSAIAGRHAASHESGHRRLRLDHFRWYHDHAGAPHPRPLKEESQRNNTP